MKETFVFEDINLKNKKIIVGTLVKALKNFNRTFRFKDDIEISTYNNFENYCQAVEEKRQKWGVTKHKNGKVYLYNPSLWTEMETGHKPSDLEASLIHEIFHAYCYQNQFNLPKWLEEGIATYLSQTFDGGQKDRDFQTLKRQYINIPDLPNLDENFGTHFDHAWSFLTAYTFVKYLIKNDGQDLVKKIPTEYKLKNKLFINHILLRWANFKKEQNEQ